MSYGALDRVNQRPNTGLPTSEDFTAPSVGRLSPSDSQRDDARSEAATAALQTPDVDYFAKNFAIGSW